MKFYLKASIYILIFCLRGNLWAQQFVISSPNEAKIYTMTLSAEMSTLAQKYKDKSPGACILYRSLQQKMTHTTIIGVFKNSQRLAFRLAWYSDPEVDLVDICNYPNQFTENIYNFLLMHSKSLANFSYD